jgi:lipopolysaccharide/colanic/teichoic acid biosynthesis glycosyltransferase
MLRFIKMRKQQDSITWSQDVPSFFREKRDFSRILERERARSDRNGNHFVLVDFEIYSDGDVWKTLHRLERCLLARLRKMDEVGWLEDKHVGVLLFDTRAADGEMFANEIREKSLGLGVLIKYEVFEYPEQNFPEGYSDRKRPSFAGSAIRNGEQGKKGVAAKLTTPTGFTSEDPSQDRKSLYPRLFKRELPFWKRYLDITGAAVSLILFSPVFVLTAGYIKLLSPRGTVFFKQKRVGIGGKPFLMWKFRTMHVHVDHKDHECYLNKLICGSDGEDGGIKPMKKLEDACRIIPFCSVLRKLAIDELPQLINVLIGDMSLVGPRPPIPYEVTNYKPWHNGRLEGLPGMTGLWQVSGKNRLTFTEMVRLDIRYFRRLSLFSDLKIMFMTPLAILSQFGDNQ